MSAPELRDLTPAEHGAYNGPYAIEKTLTPEQEAVNALNAYARKTRQLAQEAVRTQRKAVAEAGQVEGLNDRVDSLMLVVASLLDRVKELEGGR